MNPGFLDIFSRKPFRDKPSSKKTIIEVDHRERNCLVSEELEKEGFQIELKELPVADYIVKETAIERKTVSDFISSMINKRLERQIEELKQYKNKLLIIEGYQEQDLYNDTNYRSVQGVNPNAIRGFLTSIALKHQIPIIFSKNYQDTAKYIAVIARKKTETDKALKAKKSFLDEKQQAQFIIESFPGIGPKTAKKLLKEFGSIKKIINAPEEKLQKILGKKSEKFIELMNHKYEA